MKYLFFFALPITVFSFCSNKPKIENNIVIKGKVKNIPGNKVYLVDGYHFDKVIDSANYINNEFTFNIHPKDGFEPYQVSISYLDSTLQMKALYLINHILSTPKQGYIVNSFILERGVTDIKGISNIGKTFIKGTNISMPVDSINISGSLETEAMLETQMMDFGFLNENKTSKIELFKKIIKKYSSSQYLLSKIYSNKSLYTKQELQEIMILFNANIFNSKLGNALQNYASNKNSEVRKFQNLLLKDKEEIPTHLFDSSSKVTMLVIWASWCGPCKTEIPTLKKIKELFEGKGLKIISVSTDESKKDWLTTLEHEKMDWQQLRVPPNELSNFQRLFDYESIPVVIFINNNNEEIKRFVGFSEYSIVSYKNLLDQLL